MIQAEIRKENEKKRKENEKKRQRAQRNRIINKLKKRVGGDKKWKALGKRRQESLIKTEIKREANAALRRQVGNA